MQRKSDNFKVTFTLTKNFKERPRKFEIGYSQGQVLVKQTVSLSETQSHSVTVNVTQCDSETECQWLSKWLSMTMSMRLWELDWDSDWLPWLSECMNWSCDEWWASFLTKNLWVWLTVTLSVTHSLTQSQTVSVTQWQCLSVTLRVWLWLWVWLCECDWVTSHHSFKVSYYR